MSQMKMKDFLLGELLLQMVSIIEIICVNVSVGFNVRDEESA